VKKKTLEYIMKNTELYDITKLMHDVLVAVSTGKSYDDVEIVSNYQTSRKALMQNRRISNLLPDFVKKYRDLPAFWGFIKNEPGGYAERRRYLGEVFAPLFDYLEQGEDVSPIDSVMADSKDITSEYVLEIWDKAIERRETDPEGAITAARTLLEATCKYILDKQSIQYDDGADLTQLYKTTAKTLNLAPSHHTEQQFKQILGGAESVVNGLSSLRNKISDAHAPPLVRAPVNSFEFHPCGHTPQAVHLMR
jgi:hypothetical protein